MNTRSISDPAQNPEPTLIHFKAEDFQEQWTKVPNMVFDLPKQGLSDPAYIILSAIIRATNGWGKEWDAVKPSQIEADTGKSANTIRKCLDELSARGLVTLLYICQSCGSSAIEMIHKEKSGFGDKGKPIKHKFVTFKCKGCGEDKKRPERRCMLNIDGLSAEKTWKRQAVVGKTPHGKSFSHAQYLQSPEWQKKRKQKLKEAGSRCQLCNAGNAELHVHHRTYENIGNEKLSDLVVLCKECHRKFHDIDNDEAVMGNE